MGLANLVDAPVLLAGDIDRGGVFAQLYGTVALLDPPERARVKATLINKFRGDVALLEPGLETLRQLCGVPVAGVVPYMRLDIDDEDSLSERFSQPASTGGLDVAVIRLPRISNFTDFAPLERAEGLSLRYVTSPAQLGEPDMILLPGTKSTIADLLWMRQNGLEPAILRAAARGTLVFGICGGYQMLGRRILDPDQLEAAGLSEVRGMGLLDMETVFEADKVQTQTEADLEPVEGLLAGLSGLPCRGYQIHMGRSEKPLPLLQGSGNVYGSYLHGFFDSAPILQGVVETLCAKKGIQPGPVQTLSAWEYRQQEYDKLAAGVRASLDMDLIYRILNREV